MNDVQNVEVSCKATIEELIRKQLSGVFFLDNRGSQMFEEVGGGNDEAVVFAITETLSHGGSPRFEVCYVLDGRLRHDGGVITMDDLPSLIEAAESERVRFYTEREAEYGESAWPR
jgi:hypothetical protein